MLVNQKLKTPLTVFKLICSVYEFYMTGSRYWGNAHEDSDWDFFDEDSTEVRNYLGSLGFTTDIARHYDTDRQCRAVYVCGDEAVPESIVQIQLVSSSKLKHCTQETLRLRFPNGFKSKDEAREIWSLAYDCYSAALELLSKEGRRP